MAGTLTLSTLSDGTNSTSATNAIQGSAKAWVNFVGSTGARFSSYNVSSVTRNGTGDYTVNFTNAFSDLNYALAGLTTASGATALNLYSSTGGQNAPTLKSTTQCRIITNQIDAYDVSIIVYR
jgi:prophage DNA circulation protein